MLLETFVPLSFVGSQHILFLLSCICTHQLLPVAGTYLLGFSTTFPFETAQWEMSEWFSTNKTLHLFCTLQTQIGILLFYSIIILLFLPSNIQQPSPRTCTEDGSLTAHLSEFLSSSNIWQLLTMVLSLNPFDTHLQSYTQRSKWDEVLVIAAPLKCSITGFQGHPQGI